mmetsp:Transcript_3746/g.5480  ORF Transcript_3746/g.5480 Transcript_3746/m.5480 type:complete len:301 (-) Transcript_3746:85-987(-)
MKHAVVWRRKLVNKMQITIVEIHKSSIQSTLSLTYTFSKPNMLFSYTHASLSLFLFLSNSGKLRHSHSLKFRHTTNPCIILSTTTFTISRRRSRTSPTRFTQLFLIPRTKYLHLSNMRITSILMHTTDTDLNEMTSNRSLLLSSFQSTRSTMQRIFLLLVVFFFFVKDIRIHIMSTTTIHILQSILHILLFHTLPKRNNNPTNRLFQLTNPNLHQIMKRHTHLHTYFFRSVTFIQIIIQIKTNFIKTHTFRKLQIHVMRLSSVALPVGIVGGITDLFYSVSWFGGAEGPNCGMTDFAVEV